MFSSEGLGDRVLHRPQPCCFPVGPHNLVNEVLGLLAHLCHAEVELGQSLVICQPFEQLLPTGLQTGEEKQLKEEI